MYTYVYIYIISNTNNERFERSGTRSVRDPRRQSRAPLVRRSAFGLIAIYNMLPHSSRVTRSVSAFQKSLQEVVTKYAAAGHPQWSDVFSPRLPLTSHPLATHV